MVTKRKFYKTTVVVTVLSENPLDGGHYALGDVAAMIDNGDCSGEVAIGKSQELNGLAAANALKAQGSDPEFFQIDELGNDLDD